MPNPATDSRGSPGPHSSTGDGGSQLVHPRSGRMRRPPACDRCYFGKKKCDGNLPVCGTCSRARQPQDVQCTYIRTFISHSIVSPSSGASKLREDRIAKEKAAASRRQVEQLEASIKGLFEQFSPTVGEPQTASAGSTDAAVSSFGSPTIQARATTAETAVEQRFRDIYSPEERMLRQAFPSFAGTTHFSPQDYAAGSPNFFSDLSLDGGVPCDEAARRSEQHDILEMWDQASLKSVDGVSNEYAEFPGDQPCDVPVTLGRLSSDTPESIAAKLHLSKEEESSLIDRFFEMTNYQIIYGSNVKFIHEGQFRHRMNSAKPPARSLILSICAVSAASGMAADGSRWMDLCLPTTDEMKRSEEIFAAASAALEISEPSLEIVHATILLGWYCYMTWSQRSSLSCIFFGMAIRMAVLLKINIDPDDLPGEMEWLEKEIRRRTFQVMFVSNRTRYLCLSLTVPTSSFTIDRTDMIEREVSFGLWQEAIKVKQPQNTIVFNTADHVTGLPTLDQSQYPTLCFDRLGFLGARAVQFKRQYGITEDILTNGRYDSAGDTLSDEYCKGVSELSSELSDWYHNDPLSIPREIILSNTEFTFMNNIPDGLPLHILAPIRHVWYCTIVMRLHRPRLLKLLLFKNETNFDMLFESLLACQDSADTVRLMMQCEIRILPPSFIPFHVGGLIVCANIAHDTEAHAVFEAGLFYTVLILLLDGKSGFRSQFIVPEAIRSQLSDILGEGALATAKTSLKECIQILGIIGARNLRLGADLCPRLGRFVDDVGLILD